MANKARFTEKHFVGKGYYLICSGIIRCDNKCVDCEELYKAIDRLGEYEDKAEQTVEVEHGRWNKNGWNDYSCSVCKVQLVGHGASGWNYCPNCGAKMDGDVQHD